MGTANTQPDLAITDEWQDVAALRPELVGQDISMQVQESVTVQFVAGGADEPDETRTGWKIGKTDEIGFQAIDHVWVRVLAATSTTLSLSIV